MVEALGAFFGDLLGVFLRQALFGFGLLAVLGVLLFFFQRWSQQFLARALGWKAVVYWTGWLGTPVHELSHAIVGWVWPGIRVLEIKLFEPDPESGVLGYVRYSVPPWRFKNIHKIVGTFILGIAPLFGGALVLLLALWLLTPSDPVFQQAKTLAHLSIEAPTELGNDFVALVRAVFESVINGGWLSLLFIYIAMAVGGHLAPSRADLKGGVVGFLTLCGVVIVLDAIFLLIAQAVPAVHPAHSARLLAQATGPFSALLLLALIVNAANLIFSFLVYQVVKAVRSRRGPG